MGGILWGGGEGSGASYQADGAFKGDATSRSSPNGHGALARKSINGLRLLQSWIWGMDVGVEVFGTNCKGSFMSKTKFTLWDVGSSEEWTRMLA